MNLFYHPDIVIGQEEIVFDKDESRHIVKVLRKSSGDVLRFTNGKGVFFKAELMGTTPKQCTARILEYQEQEERPYKLHMAVAPTKNNDRYEWFLEKATEIGIDFITPIYCDNSERKTIKPDRFERIIESAMKQSLKAYKPVLQPAVDFNTFLETYKGNTEVEKCIAHCEDGLKSSLKDLVSPGQDVLIMIGPEGDFSPQEIRFALDVGYKAITLGHSRLRTETAGIVACHSMGFINEM